MPMIKIYTGADLVAKREQVKGTWGSITDAVYALRDAYPAAYMFDDLECTDFVVPSSIPGAGFLYVIDLMLFFDTLSERARDMRVMA
jgi:hypothetical protein